MALSTVLLVVLVLVREPRGFFDAVDALGARYEHDALASARCRASCWHQTNKNSCVKSCLAAPFNKPGRCPQNEKTLSPFDAVCLKTCTQDNQCSNLKKCCRHSCGVTCQHPEELLSAVGIPPIPQDLKLTEGLKKRTVHIEWNPGQPTPGVVLYLLEERHHTGRNFFGEDLSDWSQCGQTNKTSHILRNFVKPARWYQFRVAAVNENGTKGFSNISPTFSVSARPRPPRAPQNVTVSPLSSDSNGTLSGELHWAPPLSELPIQKYKVFWSRRLHGDKALNSVLVNQRVVSKEETTFLLQNLQPNSLYFLQIQALAQYGNSRLKGEKSGLVLNTTNYMNVTHNLVSTKPPIRNKIQDLQVLKIYWAQNSLKAKIIWKPGKDSSKYAVSLWAWPCHKNSKSRNHFKLAVTTKMSHYVLTDLEFECRYRVSVKSISEEGIKSAEDTSITFLIPSCSEFKKTNRKAKCTN
ncbi:anosmin-1 [Tribolium castaneum]|uniref:Anosmin-1-like Protein n=1 Tax=Tribolium castaneum TaxID=7070 RepID=A0A139WM55_TRICA|nr:PREDICTED: anosmin-1 [Tribolium castaneum]KYB29099.1 Anosmin-1-like Protein [Tribolium castaneum]|eukprot:XP_008201369.1 PREDICTED: anosmin-1 [Tribolium castaneum]